MIRYMDAIIISYEYDNILLHKGQSVLICLSASILLPGLTPANTYILACWRLKPLVRSCDGSTRPLPSHIRPSDPQA